MKLYHYTSISLGEAILSSALSEGHLMHSNGDMSHHVVWLTTDPHPGGHGLTLGNEKLTESQQEHMKRVQRGSVSNNLTQDKTQVRFTVELEPAQLPTLMSFMSYCDTYENRLFAKWYGVSCLVDARTVSEKELKRLMRTAATKERTWWLSFGPVPASAFVKVEFKVKGKYETYDFERHGREAMRHLGFTYPAAAAQAEIQSIS